MTPSRIPLIGPPPPELPLVDAPLVRVLAQVRFPLIASIETSEFIAPFQEAIRPDFPALRLGQSRAIVVSPEGVMDARSSGVWQFHDATGAWRVTLTPEFLALETVRYSNRDEFLTKLRQVLAALHEHVNPRVTDRLGIRYIDRIEHDLDSLPDLVRPEVSGILATPLATHLRHSIVESLFDLPDERGQLQARWGQVPARGSVDPDAIEPIDHPSWILDLDAFIEEQAPFDVDDLVSKAQHLAERIYSVFRWAVSDEYSRRFGGKP